MSQPYLKRLQTSDTHTHTHTHTHTQYWINENPYVTSAMDFNKHADKRHPDNIQTQQSKNFTLQSKKFTPCAGYLGFVPQVFPL